MDIYNYYGLTETSGICISQNQNYAGNTGIGKPVNAIVQIVDDSNQPVQNGDQGELRIFSEV